MTELQRSIRKHGGLAATHELYADGFTRATLHRAAESGEIIRVRQGWYSTSDVHPYFLEAARIGGALTCLSALDVLGFWSPSTPDLHVSVAPNAARLRTRRSKITRLADTPHSFARIHWRDSVGGHRLVLPPISCLSELIACQPAEVVTAVADSVLHINPLLHDEWALLVERSPVSKHRYLTKIDGVCESGTESIFAFRMAPYALPLHRQISIGGVGRVDFRIGEKLVVEVDGAEYHTDSQRFEADRRRDALLSALGYRVLRFSYRQVMFGWAEVEAAVLGAVFRGDHL